MKWHMAVAAIMALCLGLFCSYPSMNNQAQAQAKAAPAASKAAPGGRITVLNPLGTPPPIKLKDMAPRLDTMDGKTIYIVDDGFVGGINLLQEMVVWFNANYPKTNIVLKRKGGGGFDAEDPQLWAEIKEKANAVIIGMGH
jgi:hypothetical protein